MTEWQGEESQTEFLNDLSIPELRELMTQRDVPYKDIVEKEEMISRLRKKLLDDYLEGKKSTIPWIMSCLLAPLQEFPSSKGTLPKEKIVLTWIQSTESALILILKK